RGGCPAHGSRVHHQRYQAADRADRRAPRSRPAGRDHQGDPRRRFCRRAQEGRPRGGTCHDEVIGAMERIPILKMGDNLLVSIQVYMHDRLAMTVQDDLTARIAETRARGVLIDISALEIVDSFIGRMLGTIAAMARVLDARTVVVGMRPAVAITLVELGLSLPGVRTALDVEKGMELIQTALAPNAGVGVGVRHPS